MNKEEQIREEIIEASRTLFQRFGLLKTTMEDIARALNKGKSTLYYYYKNKDEIFEAVITNEIRDVFREVMTAVENGSTGEEKLRIYFLTMINSIKKRILLFQIIKGEIGENLKTIVNLKYRMDNHEVQCIKEILVFGMKRKEWVKEIEPNLDLLSYVITSAIRGITLDLIVEEKFPDWDTRINFLSEIFLRGLKR